MNWFHFLLAVALSTGVCALADGETPKTGSFESTFTTRSPLSEMKKLAERLKIENPGPDYDLSKEPFLVFVPSTYEPTKPIGLIVLVNYKPSDTLPNPVLPQLAEANIGLVVSKSCPDQLWQRAGMALDAVHNLEQQYTIDPRRIYVFGGAERPLPTGKAPETAERLGLNYPEIFTGTFSFGFSSFRQVDAGNRQFYPAELPPIAPKQLALAKDRAFVLSIPQPSDRLNLIAKSFTQSGLKHVKTANITLSQYHYPNYTTDWIPDVLKFMDDATAKLKLPTTAPVVK